MDPPKRDRRWYATRVGALLFLLALLVLTLLVTTRKDTSNMETALWTFILFAVGTGISYYFGRVSIEQAAKGVVRPQARAAARRLATLGYAIASFSRLMDRSRRANTETARRNDGKVPIEDVEFAYDVLAVEIDIQKRMVIDALEDWRQFDPDTVSELLEEEDDE